MIDALIFFLLVFVGALAALMTHLYARERKRVKNIAKAAMVARSLLGPPESVQETLITPIHVWTMYRSGLDKITREILRTDVDHEDD